MREGIVMFEGARQFCTFFLDGRFLGVDVAKVQEVIRQQEMTRIPLAGESIRGLVNLRGQIVTAIELRRCFGIPERESEESPMIVVRTEEGAVSLLVDEIDEVVDVDGEAFESPPDNLDAHARALTGGVYKFTDRLMLILDTEAVIEHATVGAFGETPDSGVPGG